MNSGNQVEKSTVGFPAHPNHPNLNNTIDPARPTTGVPTATTAAAATERLSTPTSNEEGESPKEGTIPIRVPRQQRPGQVLAGTESVMNVLAMSMAASQQ